MKRVLLIGSEGYVGSQLLKNIAHDVNLVAVDIKTGMDFMDMSDVALSAFDEILSLLACLTLPTLTANRIEP